MSDSSRTQRLYEILGSYHEAVEAGQPPERGAFLAAHPDLAQEIEDYLKEQDRLDRLAKPLRPVPAGETGTGPVAADRIAEIGDTVRYVGDYGLIREIARGGMGVVFEACQISLNRTVALKMILAGDLADESDRQRFRQEAEATASLDHPNIVPIYEVGTHSGHAYFSMKLIDGGSLSEHLSEYSADSRKAACLLAEIARAVHHAHLRGILHRDLKPSNILIDSDGHPQVTDFGLAKRVDSDSGLTASDAMLGTPSYMAPEQASPRRGGITTATDVYGLGAILYAMLTGRAPFRGSTPLETLEMVRSLEPEPLSRNGQAVDRDLQTICLKCLAKNPQDRYGSAVAVADDLERWLRGEPIEARPAGKAERAWRWCRRNPVVAMLLAAVGSLLTALSIVLIAATMMLRDQRDEARSNFAAAQAVVDEYLTKVSERKLLREPGLQSLRNDLLSSALRYYESFLDRYRDDPQRRAECAAAAMRVGRITQTISSPANALAQYERALGLYRELAIQGRLDADTTEGMAAALLAVGLARSDGGDTRAAQSLYEEAIALLSIPSPARSSTRELLARANHEIGAILVHFGDFEGAKAHYRRAVAILESLRAERPADLDIGLGLVSSLFHHGWLLSDTNSTESWSILNQAHRILLELSAVAPRDPQIRSTLASSHTNLGNANSRAGRLDEAADSYRQSLGIARSLADSNPDVEKYRLNVSIDLSNLAELLRMKGDFDEARKLSDEAIAIAESGVAAAPHVSTYQAKLVSMLAGRVEFELEAGRMVEGLAIARRAREVATRLAIADPSARHDELLARVLVNTARCMIEPASPGTAELDSAAADLEKAARRLSNRVAVRARTDDYLEAEIRLDLARVLRLQGKRVEARNACEEALAQWKRLAAVPGTRISTEIGVARALFELANLEAGDNRERSLAIYREADERLAACLKRSPGYALPAFWRDRIRQAIELSKPAND